MFETCAQTVSILYAIAFGAGDACISIDLWSILSAFAAFMVIVVIVQFVARKIWARLTQTQHDYSDVHDKAEDRPIVDDPNYRNSAIRTRKR